MKKYYRGIAILIVTVIFNVVETIYFGCNATAFTPAETICDGLSSLGLFVGVFVAAIDYANYFWEKFKASVKCVTGEDNSEKV